MLFRTTLFVLVFFNLFSLFSQPTNDDFYREDQIYVSLYYNSLNNNNIDDLKENNFSSSINFGFIRDIPLNKSGKFALGIGAGLGFNSFNNNLKINNTTSNNFVFDFLENQREYDKNTYSFTEIQFPLEIRLRNSSIDNYKFWRLYAGLRYSKLLTSNYKFKSENLNYSLDSPPINTDQLGLTLNIGFNTWNIGLYKAIRPFFNQENNNLNLDLEQFKVGLIFYIL